MALTTEKDVEFADKLLVACHRIGVLKLRLEFAKKNVTQVILWDGPRYDGSSRHLMLYGTNQAMEVAFETLVDKFDDFDYTLIVE